MIEKTRARISCGIAFIVLIGCFMASYAFAKTPMSSQKFPDSSRIVILLKGGGVVPFNYQKNPIQWVGYAQISYGITNTFAVEIEGGVGNKNYRLAGNATSDSIDALSKENYYYGGIALRLKALRLNPHVHVSFLIGAHYIPSDPGFDVGLQIESRTGRIGLVIGLTVAAQIMQTSNIFPVHIHASIDYSITKQIAFLLQSDIGFAGGRLAVLSGIMFSF